MSYDNIRHVRKQKILDGVKECFINKGMSEMTVKNVSDAADVSRQTFYKYFSCMDSAVLEVHRDCIIHFMSYITGEEQKESAPEYIRNIFLKLQTFCDRFPLEIRFISTFNDYVLNRNISEEYKKEYAEHVLHNKNISKWLTQGRQNGEIRTDADIKVIRAIIVNTILSTAERYVSMAEEKITKTDFVNGECNMVLRMLS